MRRWVSAGAMVLLVSAVLHADLTLKQTVTVEGGAAAMMGGSVKPELTTRMKGTKARVEVTAMNTSTVMIFDVAARQMITLNAADKTARVMDLPAPGATPAAPAAPEPDMDVSLKPTGEKRTIDTQVCDGYTVAMSLGMASMMKNNPQVPPEAMQAMQDIRMVMTGTMWIAKEGAAVAEYAAFQKAALAAGMGNTVAGAMGGSNNGLDKLMAASAAMQGLPYLSEMTMNFEGTGQIVEMMKQMGAMTITNKVTAMSTEALSDDLFKVPAGYTMVK